MLPLPPPSSVRVPPRVACQFEKGIVSHLDEARLGRLRVRTAVAELRGPLLRLLPSCSSVLVGGGRGEDEERELEGGADPVHFLRHLLNLDSRASPFSLSLLLKGPSRRTRSIG